MVNVYKKGDVSSDTSLIDPADCISRSTNTSLFGLIVLSDGLSDTREVSYVDMSEVDLGVNLRPSR